MNDRVTRAIHRIRNRYLGYLITSAIFLAMGFVLPVVGLPGAYTWAAALLCFALYHFPNPVLSNAWMARIGQVSFSMYIVHFALLFPVFTLMSWITRHVGAGLDDSVFLILYFPVLALAAFAVSTLTFRFIEQPGIRLGRRLIKCRAAAIGRHALAQSLPG